MSLLSKFMLSIICLGTLLGPSSLEAENTKDPLHIWGTRLSPFVRKVINVAEEKKIPYELYEVFPKALLEATQQEVPEELSQASPLGKIPVARYKNYYIPDSAVISQFIEKKWEKPTTTYPKKAKAYAKALWYEKYADTAMAEVIHKIFLEVVVKPYVLNLPTDGLLLQSLLDEHLPKILNYLENAFQGCSREFLVGNKPTIADFAVANQMYSLEIANIQWDRCQYPYLNQYLNRVFELPSFRKGLPSQPFIKPTIAP